MAIVCTAALLATASFLTACCGGGNDESPTESIRITAGFKGGPSTLNPLSASHYSQTAFLGPIYEPLLFSMEDGSFESCLAESWEQSENGLEWIINIDPDAEWSDGQPVTADDVLFTYQLQWESVYSVHARSSKALAKKDLDGYPATDALIKLDADTVKFTLNDTYAAQVFLASLSTVFICPEHIWVPIISELQARIPAMNIEDYELEEESAATIAAALIGSGPFLFGSWRAEEYMLFKNNTNYWKGLSANVDEVIFKIFDTEEAAISALEAGDVDMLATVGTESVSVLLQNPDINADITTNYNSTIMFYLNLRYPPLNIYEVRKAIDMALNKQDMITHAAYGYGSLPQMVPFAPGLAESNPDVAWIDQYVDTNGDQLSLNTRIDNANALLDAIPGMSTIAAGIDGVRTYNGEKVSFEGLYLSPHTYTYQQATELLAGDLAEIGIEIIPTEETSSFGPKVFSGNQVWDYETIIFGYPSPPNFSSRVSLSVVRQWGHERWGSSYDGCVVGWNNDPAEAPPGTVDGRPQTYDTPYESPTQDQLDQWMAIYNQLVAESIPLTEALQETRVIADAATRQQAILEVQEDFMDALPIICLYHPNYISVFRTDRFEGWGDPEGIYYDGFAPPTVSVKTLLSIKPINN